jgi:DNA-cytosine methyltransferase
VNYLSVCSGVEAATVAWHDLGWKAVAYSEIEKFPSEVLAHHYPTVPNMGDMTKYKEWNFNESINLLVGGTPCQSFSVAGLRKGLEDPRGNLALTYIGLLDKFRPKWCVWENVPGVLSSNGGRDFGSFLGALVECGYGFAYRVLDAQNFGVPQRRRRVFVVGCLGDWEAPAKVLFERESLCGDIKKSRKSREATTRDSKESVGALCARDYKGVGSQYVNEGKCVVDGVVTTTGSDKNIFGTLMANAADKQWLGNQEAFTGDYHIVSRSTKVFETHPADSRVKEMGDVCQTVTSRWGTGGGNVPIAVQDVTGRDKAQNGKGWSDEGVSYTVDTHATQGVVHSVSFEPGITRREGNPSRVVDELSSTLRADMGDNQVAVAYSIREDAKANNFSATELEVTPALQALRPSVQSHHAQTFIAEAVDVYNQTIDGQITATLTEACGGTNTSGPKIMSRSFNVNARPDEMRLEDEKSGTLTNSQNSGLLHGMAVRRLTPVECERLQGFPDNYTNIPWKGKDAPDSARYKAMGNSMAVPVMRWVGQRIQEIENEL